MTAACCRSWLRGIVGLALVVGCRAAPHPPTICSLRPPGDRALAAETWLDLLVPERRQSRAPTAALHDCRGAALSVGEHQPSARVLPDHRRGADDLSVVAVGDELLVWARLVDLDDGDALGPIALLRRHDDHLEITAIGALRAPARAVVIESSPPAEGPRVLLVRGERCPTGGACVREVQLLIQRGVHLVDPPWREGGRVGPARVVLGGARERRRGASIERSILERRVLVDREGPRVVESMNKETCSIEHVDRCEDEAAIHRVRRLTIDDQGIATDPSIWGVDGSAGPQE